MTYYDSFDCKINCEELYTVEPDEYDDVMCELAKESQAQQGFTEWLDSLESTERAAHLAQAALERKEAQRKAWFNGYSNKAAGAFYGSIAV